ncbi:MAG: glycosyltransferase family 4 protein [Isosphaeraceae bacterium]|nr:glycosyltransferase family 4 protein [Isosphaeraceae bacterium]
MRRIAYVTPLYFGDDSCVGGGERYPQNLAKGVALSAPEKYSVDLITFGTRPSQRELAPGVALRVIVAAGVPRTPFEAVSWELPATLDEYDLVHVHQSATRCGEVAVAVAKQLRKPTVITDHGAHTSTLGLEYGLAELADAVVAYSDFGAALHHVKSTPIHVVKGGVDSDVFTPTNGVRVRDRFTYVGRLLPHKGIDRLIDALPADLPLTVCGRVYHEDYFRLLRSKAEGKLVEFVTDADDEAILALYRRAWANVLSSVHTDCYGNSFVAPELMGFTLLEAMACGTPAICARTAAMPEFVDHGETGFVYDDLASLTNILQLLASDSSLVERLGRQAREAVEARFDLRAAGRSMAKLYDDLIDSESGSAREAA